MAIFNSLGSNFSFVDGLRNLFGGAGRGTQQTFIKELVETYSGRVTLTHKGRQALQLALELSGLPKGSRVATNGFTCYVVYQAIERAGYKPLLVDITKDSAHFDVQKLEAAYKKQSFEAVIIQNTFGIPVAIQPIENFARLHNVLMIEDLAHCLGSIYADGREAGTVGDLVMLSFSQDKTLDAVAGGTLIDRRHVPAAAKVGSPVGGGVRLKQRLYPGLTWLIRLTFALGIGRVLRRLFQSLHLLARPMDEVSQHAQKPSTAGMMKRRWDKRTNNFDHRREIAAIYQEYIPEQLQFGTEGQPVYVRFPLQVDNPTNLLRVLKKAGYYLSDTWYDAPIAPKRYMPDTSYQTGDCPNAEALVARIINLPTHQGINPETARKICEVIIAWQG